MDENLEETVSADLNFSQLVSENVRNDKAKKARVYGVGNQGRCTKQRAKKTIQKRESTIHPRTRNLLKLVLLLLLVLPRQKLLMWTLVVDVDISC